MSTIKQERTDAQLIRESIRGEGEAFVELVGRHATPVHSYLARRAGRSAADDLLGDVWVAAFEARRRYDQRFETARPWLFGIARNVLRAYLRKEGRPVFPTAGSVDPWPDIDAGLDAVTAVMNAIRSLPEGDREVLLLVAWEDLSVTQAAKVLGIPPGTARWRLHRARAALRPASGAALVVTSDSDKEPCDD